MPLAVCSTPCPNRHRSGRTRLLTAVILCAPLLAFASGKLPPALSSSLENARLPANHAAFFVQRVDAETPLLAHNASQPMNPASVMKILTAYAALELLGPAYRWKTQALAETLPQAGRLTGNLYLKGSGDPSLTVEQLWLFLRQLRSRGVTDIAGDLVLDRSEFQLPPHDPAAFDNEPLRPYNAGADALLINFNSLRIALLPDATSRTVTSIVETPAEGLRINPRIQLADGPCGDWREKLAITTKEEGLTLSGSYAASCGEKALHLSVLPADDQIALLFSTLWRELGGTFSGKVRSGTAPANGVLLANHESPALSEIVHDMNKWSNNVMARQLLLSLAPSRPATPEAAKRRLDSWLQEKGVEGSVVDNGAGLSREARLSAAGLGKLLLAAWRSPVMPELMASLPIAGSDGTLKKRLGESRAAGRAHLKTGYIEGVRSIAGYVMDRSGQRWVVVGILNDPHMKNGSKPLDDLVRWVVER